MDIVNRLRSAVSTVQTTVSSVLPGNPVTREYDVAQHVASAGPELVWKIYSGVKKSTKQDVSVWVFEKKLVERWPKHERDMFLELQKLSVKRLTRLRHPRLLTVEHGLEESRDTFAFATEPVFCSMANALGRRENMPSVVPPEITDLQLGDVEIRHGFLQLSEALAFLHNDVKMWHRNVCPESVVITKNCAWKLATFNFCVETGPNSPATGEQNDSSLEWRPSLPPVCQPMLDFMAPEYVVGGRVDSAADMYSLGILAYAVFNAGRPLMEAGNNLDIFTRNVSKLKMLPVNALRSIPDEFREYVKMCLNFTPDLRPDATQFSKISYFDNLGVKTLNYLESLCQCTNLQKSDFFKQLPDVLSTLSKRLLFYKVLPAIASESRTKEMVPFILPSVFAIAEGATQGEFVQAVMPHLIPLLAMREPVQITLLFLQKMELLLTKMPPEDVRTHVLPLIYDALAAGPARAQELCLEIIPTIANLFDAQKLVPQLMQVITGSQTVTVKVNALLCLGKIIDSLEQWMVSDQILPMLPKINSKEPGVLMACLGIYKMAFNSKYGIGKDACAKSALPFLVAMSVEQTLNESQFEAFITLIRQMLDKVEKEQRLKVRQLSALEERQRGAPDFSDLVKKNAPASASGDDLASLGKQETAAKKQGTGLSLEEKQRIAREQEQTLKLRTQAPLKPAAPKPTPTVRPPPPPGGTGFYPASSSAGTTAGSGPKDLGTTAGAGPKDLTSTLMGNSMNVLPRPSAPPSSIGQPVLTPSPAMSKPMAPSQTSVPLMQPTRPMVSSTRPLGQPSAVNRTFDWSQSGSQGGSTRPLLAGCGLGGQGSPMMGGGAPVVTTHGVPPMNNSLGQGQRSFSGQPMGLTAGQQTAGPGMGAWASAAPAQGHNKQQSKGMDLSAFDSINVSDFMKR